MDKKSLINRYQFLLKLIIDAGDKALQFFHQKDSLDVKMKATQDFVSNADREIEQFLTKNILSKFPDDNVLGEEFKLKKQSLGSGLWIIDPIDGTSPFLKGLPHWSISIGFVIDNDVVFGAVYDPMLNDLYHAFQSQGSFVNDKPIKCDPDSNISSGMFAIGYSNKANHEHVLKMTEVLIKNNGLSYRNGSAALMMSYSAAGKLNGYCEPWVNSWDEAGGLIICKEAGMKINNYQKTDWIKNGNPLLVAPPHIYDQLSKLVPWQL